MKTPHVTDFDLLVVGETYLEFRCKGDVSVADSYERDIGGADLVVASTAARLGSSVGLISAIARDPFHAFMRERLLAQGINTDHVVTVQGYNGIYFCSERHSQEREYLFHRPGSAALSVTPALVYDDLIDSSRIVYASSELQSVSKSARHTVFKALHYAHANDIMAAFDPNLRLQRWALDDAKEALWGVLPLLDVVLPSAPEETKALFGYERPLDVIGFLWDRGVSIVVVKTGPAGCVVGYDGKVEEISLPEQEQVSDTTLIGSVFNGAFLHAVARGRDPFEAARYAGLVAAVKGHRGGGVANLPREDELAAA